MILKIGHLEFHVRYPTDTETAQMTQEDHVAVCYKVEGTILLRRGLNPALQAELLVHEALHGVEAAYIWPDKMDEEAVCTRLAGPLVSFMRDNPSAVSAIIAASQGVPLPIN